MTLIKVKQGSAEWLHERVGRVTASRVKDVMDFLKQTKAEEATGIKRPSAKRQNYLAEIVSEILTQEATEHYVSPYMQWGIETEADARAAYEVESGEIVDQTGLFVHDSIPRFAASPDGLIGTDGLFEAKCPQTKTHIEYVLAGVVPEEYLPQIYAQMACSGRTWCDFVSFDPRLPEPLRLMIQRVHRDDAKIAAIEAAVLTFLEEVLAMMNALKEKVGDFTPPSPTPSNPISYDERLMEEAFLTDEDFEGLI